MTRSAANSTTPYFASHRITPWSHVVSCSNEWTSRYQEESTWSGPRQRLGLVVFRARLGGLVPLEEEPLEASACPCERAHRPGQLTGIPVACVAVAGPVPVATR